MGKSGSVPRFSKNDRVFADIPFFFFTSGGGEGGGESSKNLLSKVQKSGKNNYGLLIFTKVTHLDVKKGSRFEVRSIPYAKLVFACVLLMEL